jgi:WD40 repeat protein
MTTYWGNAFCCLLLLQVRDHSQAILCLSPTPHADRLLTASKDNQLRLWDFRQLGTVQVGALPEDMRAKCLSS